MRRHTSGLFVPEHLAADEPAPRECSTYIPVSGGGGGGLYPGFAPPSSPNALDDEFDSLGLDGSWTVWDEGSNFNPGNPEVFQTGRGLFMSCDDPGAAQMQGIFKSAPVGDFTLWGRFSVGQENQDLCLAGLMIGEDLASNPAGGRLAVAGLLANRNFGPKADRNTWGNYQSRLSGGASPIIQSTAWLRLRRSGANFNCEWSDDGLTWFYAVSGGFTAHNLAAGVDTIGIWCSNDSTINPFISYAKHFRVTNSAAFDQVLPSADYE